MNSLLRNKPRYYEINKIYHTHTHMCTHTCILNKLSFQVCLMDQADMISNKGMLGCCVIGPHEEGPAQDHWIDMQQSPRKAVAMWHALR